MHWFGLRQRIFRIEGEEERGGEREAWRRLRRCSPASVLRRPPDARGWIRSGEWPIHLLASPLPFKGSRYGAEDERPIQKTNPDGLILDEDTRIHKKHTPRQLDGFFFDERTHMETVSCR
ncbi:hypothetical protein VPH35_031475 [Triticum aestivum]